MDNVLSLVVEEHIVRDLEYIFSPKSVSRLKDEDVLQLASEPDGVKRERLFYQEQITKLRDGHKILKSVMGGMGS